MCSCGRVVGATLWKWRALMSPDYPACLAAERPHLSVTVTGHLLFIEPFILDLCNLSLLPVEELTDRRQPIKMKSCFASSQFLYS